MMDRSKKPQIARLWVRIETLIVCFSIGWRFSIAKISRIFPTDAKVLAKDYLSHTLFLLYSFSIPSLFLPFFALFLLHFPSFPSKAASDTPMHLKFKTINFSYLCSAYKLVYF